MGASRGEEEFERAEPIVAVEVEREAHEAVLQLRPRSVDRGGRCRPDAKAKGSVIDVCV